MKWIPITVPLEMIVSTNTVAIETTKNLTLTSIQTALISLVLSKIETARKIEISPKS